MEHTLHEMRQRMAFLLRAISNPASLSPTEQSLLQQMILDEARKQENAAISAALSANTAALSANAAVPTATSAGMNMAAVDFARSATVVGSAPLYNFPPLGGGGGGGGFGAVAGYGRGYDRC